MDAWIEDFLDRAGTSRTPDFVEPDFWDEHDDGSFEARWVSVSSWGGYDEIQEVHELLITTRETILREWSLDDNYEECLDDRDPSKCYKYRIITVGSDTKTLFDVLRLHLKQFPRADRPRVRSMKERARWLADISVAVIRYGDGRWDDANELPAWATAWAAASKRS